MSLCECGSPWCYGHDRPIDAREANAYEADPKGWDA